MSQMKLFHAMERMMEQGIEEAVRETFRTGRSSGDAADDVDAFVHSLLVRLGLRSVGEPIVAYKVRHPQFLSDLEEVMPPLEKADDAPAPEPPTHASLMPPAVCLTARQRTSPVSISSPVSSFHMTGSRALASLKYSLPVSMSV
jgi:hypothetical protein